MNNAAVEFARYVGGKQSPETNANRHDEYPCAFCYYCVLLVWLILDDRIKNAGKST